MRLANDVFFDALNDALELSSLPPFESCDTSKMPIIYILGVPRSGTTLLSQLMIRHFDIAYTNNIMARFWKCPEVGIRLTHALLSNKSQENISYESDYGRSSEVAGPHEFAYFWRHWLPFDKSQTSHLSKELLKTVDIDGLRRTLVEKFLWGFNKPLIFKYLYLGMQAEFLSQIFDNSFFIYIERNHLDLTRSILHARKIFFDNYDTWFSVIPKGYPFDSSNPCEEVFLQVQKIHEQNIEQLSKIDKSLHMHYEDLCLEPRKSLERISKMITSYDCEINFTNMNMNSLSIHHEKALPDDMETTLKDLFDDKYFLPNDLSQ